MDKQIEFFESKLAFEIDAFDLFTALNEGEQIVLIDTRPPEDFRNEHIPGAVSLPYREMNTDTTQDLSRDLVYVTYCQGIECNGSTKGALNMSKLGYRVKELVGGIAAWKLDGFATEGESAEKGLPVACAC